MATFAVDLHVANGLGAGFTPVEALVDTGSSYTTLPASLLRSLGVKPMGSRSFLLANGEAVSRDVGQARVRLDGHALVTVVLFGDEAALPLLGAVTMEEMGLESIRLRRSWSMCPDTSYHTMSRPARRFLEDVERRAIVVQRHILAHEYGRVATSAAPTG